MEGIKLTWLGHACFIIEADGYKILIDPYKNGYVDGYRIKKQNANAVYCSHEHSDHNARDIAVLEEKQNNPFTVTEINSFHDNKGGSLRGKNTIRIFEANGLRVVHMGDIGCDIAKETEALIKNADAVMIPVGGTYTLTANEASALLDKITPRVTIPMHYRTDDYGYAVLQHIDEFTNLRDGCNYLNTNGIKITKTSQNGTFVLKYTEE